MKARVLIVEDERLVARELRMRLEEAGYRVTANVASAEDALRAATEQVPDLVLMDIHIQGERDGIEAAQLLQRSFDVPVVFLTAHSDETTVQRAKLIGAAGYLIKPPKERELVVAVEVALHKHEMARQLREREKWFSTTLRSIGDAVIATDPIGNISYMNPVAEVLTGWRAEAARGKPASLVVKLVRDTAPSEPRTPAAGSSALVTHGGTLTDHRGRRRTVSDSTSPIVDESGALLGGVLILRDISEQRALERQLEAAERLASLGTLAAGVAHEINNPLTWIVSNLVHITEGLADPEATREQLSALRELAVEALGGAERIQHVVRDLSVFSRRAPDRSVGAVAVAIRSAVESTPSPVPIEIRMDTGVRVAIDESRLATVLANILANAVQAVADAPGRAHRIAVRVATGEDTAVIEVEDSGIGMDPETRARAFDAFFTTRPVGSGTGLGLSIAHGLVSAAGGSIRLESTLGAGTTVTVELPLVKRVESPRPAPSASTARGRVLAIDDEESMRRLMKRALRAHDVEAVTGREALRLVKAGERYDVILCDLMMPDIGGMELYEAILALDPDQARRISFVTGGAFSIKTAEFLASTRNRVLEKPFTPHDLQALVAEQLALAPGPGSAT